MLGTGAPSNPFSTANVRPGAVRWVGGDSVAMVAARLEAAGAGQIVGAHGTGKSTLLAHLVRHLRASGREVLVTRDGKVQPRPGVIVALDGGESMPRASLRALARRAASRASVVGSGIVATAHCDLGLPTIARTSVDVAIARAVVREVLARWPSLSPPPDDDLAASLSRHGGDLRLVLFELYDRHERRASPLTVTSTILDSSK
ncbi:MAG: hypothetical protein HYV09_08545 [Deltaproteobacteria bacterium]|nr:hypothetical protein [Deltaproteobacteria bacterium]